MSSIMFGRFYINNEYVGQLLELREKQFLVYTDTGIKYLAYSPSQHYCYNGRKYKSLATLKLTVKRRKVKSSNTTTTTTTSETSDSAPSFRSFKSMRSVYTDVERICFTNSSSYVNQHAKDLLDKELQPIQESMNQQAEHNSSVSQQLSEHTAILLQLENRMKQVEIATLQLRKSQTCSENNMSSQSDSQTDVNRPHQSSVDAGKEHKHRYVIKDLDIQEFSKKYGAMPPNEFSQLAAKTFWIKKPLKKKISTYCASINFNTIQASNSRRKHYIHGLHRMLSEVPQPVLPEEQPKVKDFCERFGNYTVDEFYRYVKSVPWLSSNTALGYYCSRISGRMKDRNPYGLQHIEACFQYIWNAALDDSD